MTRATPRRSESAMPHSLPEFASVNGTLSKHSGLVKAPRRAVQSSFGAEARAPRRNPVARRPSLGDSVVRAPVAGRDAIAMNPSNRSDSLQRLGRHLMAALACVLPALAQAQVGMRQITV